MAHAEINLWSLAFRSSGVVFFVLVLLIGFSLSSWAIIIWKFLELRRAKQRSDDFLDLFWKAKRLDHLYSEAGEYADSPVGQVFAAGYQEVEQVLKARSSKGGMEEASVLTTTETAGVETVERALRRAANQEVGKLERLLTFLATTASSTPFIGLFGTVWGIMNSFREIGARGSAGLAVVAPGISEALIATAVGLAAAIPAVIAYNHYQSRVKVISGDIENFTADFLNLVGRHFMRM
ncbi:MAG: protein TolQ [Candidatus Tectomicrobia bacterium RIFCSPLOWO2_12_FULL_69_37]|nr:MAG: protein TolQ [Candidatus Tectomicrobia bacterium RIFCSPLOWO2_12_FULL_69_37]OGL59799.1 MAG: protein TolQ [Candidatus Tectomicrobia bacterium RIFCSPLOWO2_02_FULL_70_19]